jgi:ribosomal protein S18 acetylase RimI-like enzyme
VAAKLACLIKLAGIEDLEAINAVESRCFSSERFSREQLRYLLSKAKAQAWIAETDEQVVGYVLGLFPQPPRPARLYSLAVLDEYRGQGIAGLLINTLLEHAKQSGYDRLRLEVDEHNLAAIAVYQRQGFEQIALLPNYYRNGHAALRFEKSL